LPPYFCRECGGSGWYAVKTEKNDHLDTNISDLYEKAIGKHKNVFFIFPWDEDGLAEDYENAEINDEFLDPVTLGLYSKAKESYIRIIRCRKVKDTKIEEVCPHCNSRNTMAFIGTGVATMASVSTGQTFASNLDDALEKDRKVLIFSNGVQDAAHHAGFIEARNYRFTFRTALQSVINKCETSVSLKELYNRFIEYWKKISDPEGNKPIEAYLYKFFPADYIGSLKIDSFKIGNEKFRKNFIEEFNHRMEWEIWSEFGYNSTIGRTLEKTGVSVSFIEQERIRIVYNQMKFWLKENQLHDILEENFVKLVTGFLYRLRIRGGIDHIFLKKFRTEKSNYYLITAKTNPQHTFIKNFGKRTRLPKFISDDKSIIAKNIFDVTYVRENAKSNWYHEYFRKCFVIFSGGSDSEKLLINDFYEKLLDYLDSEKILDKKTAAGIKNYAINPAELKISNKVKQFQCSVCGHQVSDIDSSESVFHELPCFQYHCNGKYNEIINSGYNYYKTVYNRAHILRIFSADHTGLLERKKREKLEYDFKNRPDFNSVNLLVATSTLEMGIDVGDLNATFNSTLPPQPSNYLQRIGRAGRASGNALIVNFIGKGQHDQFYYQEPVEMMEGTIGTPGCFLEAKEIIRRHFIAYCFDSWATDDSKNHIIPRIIRDLKVDKIKPDDPDFIINKLILFIKSENSEGKLFNKFKLKYLRFIDIKESIDNLEKDVINGEIIEILKKIYFKLFSEIDYYLKKKETIADRLKSLPSSDPEKLEIEKDLKNLNGAIKLFRSRNFIEYLTNIGILPNYAFPETGVTLDAQIRERTGDSEGASFINKSLEIVRPAKTAIRELAPDNTFYSQGYKLNISGIHIINRKDELLEYRYCSKCDNLMLNIEIERTPCTKCGDNSWRQPSNVHNFVKMASMVSYNDSVDSVILDSTEERENVLYSLSKHFRFDNSSSQGAHVLKQIPFGIEYVKNIILTEVNTGKVDGFFDRSRLTQINEQEHSDYGFIVCRSCGKVSTRISNEHTGNKFHFQYCKNKDELYSGSNDEIFDEIYLFRELQSEAIKILLPVQEIDSEANLKLFKAGLFLGLKKYYKGNPQHLELHEYSEPNKHTGKKDRYLIMLESIPGGTGYLSKLFNVSEFSELLKLAYESIRDCNCQLKEKDGCYHCIYTYSNQGDRDILSRKSAEAIFEKIYKKTNEWIYLENGLNDLTNSGNIEESELEERFPKILIDFSKNTVNRELGFDFSKIKVDDVTNYLFKIVQNSNTIIYQITPQVRLDRRDGVQFGTVADFVIRCVDYKINGETNISIIESIKPIAIYLDGYAFHASIDNNRFVSDFMKRNSIRDSGKIISYTLTWDDLTRFEKKETDYLSSQSNNSVITSLRKICHPVVSKGTDLILKNRNNLERLIVLLEYPFYEKFSENIRLFLFTLQEHFLGKCVNKEDIENLCKNDIKFLSNYNFIKNNQEMIAYIDKVTCNDIFDIKLFQTPTDLDIIGCLILDGKNSKGTLNKKNWENFWHCFNLLQFFPSFKFRLSVDENSPKIINDNTLSNEKIFENFDIRYHPLVVRLIEKRIDFNKTETFVLEFNGEIIAEADLAIESLRLVFGAFTGCEETFSKHGYIVNEIEMFNIETI
jgi:DEAD/DEAH box helicase domain-containing protein